MYSSEIRNLEIREHFFDDDGRAGKHLIHYYYRRYKLQRLLSDTKTEEDEINAHIRSRYAHYFRYRKTSQKYFIKRTHTFALQTIIIADLKFAYTPRYLSNNEFMDQNLQITKEKMI